ncbi:MAG TPA: RNA methyltransferase [Thermoleophilia bacterium]|nr:RNA methyltransferase [Thermoleophilia bacterium]
MRDDAPDAAARLNEAGHPVGDAPVYEVNARVAARLSTLETPAAVMAVFPLPAAPALGELRSPEAAGARAPHDPQPSPPLVVYADRLADPGNLGTLVRAAAAFAAAALVASPGSVDLFSPKVARASMGAVFALPLDQGIEIERVVDELRPAAVFGLVAHGGRPLDEVASTGGSGPVLLCVGAERAGLSAATLAVVTERVTIPLAAAAGPAIESLNAGVAGAIALYEFSRRPAGAARAKDGAGPSGPAPQKE